LVQVAQRGCAMHRENVQARNDLRIACLQAEIRRLLEGCHLAAGVAAEVRDVGLIPGLEGYDFSPPALCQGAMEVVGIAQIQREALAQRVRPAWRLVPD